MNPALLSAAYEPEAHNDFIWAVVGSPWGLLALWLVLINAAAFLAFGLDKWKAKRKEKNEKVRRVPEKTLLILSAQVTAVAGGAFFDKRLEMCVSLWYNIKTNRKNII